jgi:hypothetical protein
MTSRSVTLRANDSINLSTGAVTRSNPLQSRTRYPWYPLAGHREGLRANDLVTLHSAFVIMAMEGGTAHLVAPIHTPDPCEACGT